jgi:hypothetical protein
LNPRSRHQQKAFKTVESTEWKAKYGPRAILKWTKRARKREKLGTIPCGEEEQANRKAIQHRAALEKTCGTKLK